MDTRPVILCVDDEPQVLDGLSLHLCRRYEVLTATSGAAGLTLIDQHLGLSVVVSDMRMPKMDGAAFLAQARMKAPHAARILLTGHSDLTSAIAAVNQGQIFRFLTKPCPPPLLLQAIASGVEQHRLVTAEKVLLEQTLRGSVVALVDILSLSNPTAFGRTGRIRQHAKDLAQALGLEPCWQLDLAAMVCQLGAVALPAETAAKVYYGQPLTPEEAEMVARAPQVTERLLSHIPRLDVVVRMLAAAERPWGARSYASADLEWKGAAIIRCATDFDALEAQGLSPSRALADMSARGGRYAADVLQAFRSIRSEGQAQVLHETTLWDLRVGMVFADDLKSEEGVLIAGRGYVVTAGFIERMRNATRQSRTQKVKVIVPEVGVERGAA